MQQIDREVRLRGRPRAAVEQPASHPASTARSRSADWSGSSACAATTSTTRPAGVIDYRTGQVLAYVGSASYTAKGNRKFQPQFDVLADGWRQPGSAIKPIDYLIGIDDGTLTARDDVHGRHDELRRRLLPTQADKLERGPVRLRRRSSSRSTSRPSRPRS